MAILGIPGPWVMSIATTLLLVSFAWHNRRTGFKRPVSEIKTPPDTPFAKSLSDWLVLRAAMVVDSPDIAAPRDHSTMANQLYLLNHSLEPLNEAPVPAQGTASDDPARSLQLTA